MICGHCKRESPSITVRVSVRAARTGNARVELDGRVLALLLRRVPTEHAIERAAIAEARVAHLDLLRTATEIEVSEELAARLDDIAVGADAEPSKVLSYLVHIELCKATGRGGAAPSLTQAKRRRIAAAVASYQARR